MFFTQHVIHPKSRHKAPLHSVFDPCRGSGDRSLAPHRGGAGSTQSIPGWFCGRPNATYAGLHPSTSVFSCQYNSTHASRPFINLSATLYYLSHWEFGGFKPPQNPEIPKALQNRAELNRIVKTVKNC